MSHDAMPMFFGRRTAHSSCTVCTSASGLLRRMKKKSLSLRERSGSSPRLTAWAFITIRLCCACRKISVRRTAAIFPLRMRSEKTFPAPTEGSWSGSPTRIRRQPGFNARSKDIINCKSTIDVSSTIIASMFKGSSSSW